MYRLGLRVNMVQLILYYYSDLVSMYTGIYLTWIIVIDIKVHFSTQEFMTAELFYGPLLDASQSSTTSLHNNPII